jgi:hypothetical protein
MVVTPELIPLESDVAIAAPLNECLELDTTDS